MRYGVLTFCLLTITSLSAHAADNHSDPQQAFYKTLQSLCGSRYEGKSVFPEDPGDDFRGALLVAHFEHCTDDEIRIPFHVGENRSRTWILRRLSNGLQLKHDHRHDDGSEDDISRYGGTTTTPGTALEQSFPADAYTADLIPEASTNRWVLILSDDASQLTYYLERHDKLRFRAVLKRISNATDQALE